MSYINILNNITSFYQQYYNITPQTITTTKNPQDMCGFSTAHRPLPMPKRRRPHGNSPQNHPPRKCLKPILIPKRVWRVFFLFTTLSHIGGHGNRSSVPLNVLINDILMRCPRKHSRERAPKVEKLWTLKRTEWVWVRRWIWWWDATECD